MWKLLLKLQGLWKQTHPPIKFTRGFDNWLLVVPMESTIKTPKGISSACCGGQMGLQLQPYNIKLRLQVSQINKSFFLNLVSHFPCPIQRPPRFSTRIGAAQVEQDEDPRVVEASVLLPHEVFGALHSVSKHKAGMYDQSAKLIQDLVHVCFIQILFWAHIVTPQR